MEVVVFNQDQAVTDLIKEKIRLIDNSLKIYLYNDIDLFLTDFNTFNDYTIFIIDLIINNKSSHDLALKINEQIKGTKIIYISKDIKYLSDIFKTSHCFYIHIDELDQYLKIALSKAINSIRNIQAIIEITCQSKTIIVPVNEIRYLERDLRRTIIHLANRDYYTYDNFKDYLTKVPDNFFECHRSFIVNFNEVREYQRNRFILKDNTVIPISRSHEKEARKAFKNFLKYQS